VGDFRLRLARLIDALRTVFPTHLVYPNAALGATLEFERLQPKLSQAERDYFFRALVDWRRLLPRQAMIFRDEKPPSAVPDRVNPHAADIRRGKQLLLESRPAEAMTAFTSVALGIGLAAACGFRVFVPLLGMSLAARSGLLPLADGFGWAQTDTGLILLAVATVLEVLAYFVPFIDNALDAVATPAAMVAGVGASASVLGDFSPVMQWGLAAVAGGGATGLVQGGTGAMRGASSASTGGLGNVLVAGGEALLSVLTTALAIFAPVLALVVVAGLCFFGVQALLRWRRGRPPVRAAGTADG
jgi:hypothetical protein